MEAHVHAHVIEPERLGRDLRERGLDALPERADAHPHDRRAVVRHPHRRLLERAERAELDRDRDPDSDLLAPPGGGRMPALLVEPPFPEQALEEGREVAGVVDDRHRAGPEVVGERHLGRR